MFDINKKIQIGNLKLDFPFFLAPMAGVTDYAFRVIAKEFGAGVVYSEFVAAHGIIRKNEKTLHMIKFSEFERLIGIVARQWSGTCGLVLPAPGGVFTAGSCAWCKA